MHSWTQKGNPPLEKKMNNPLYVLIVEDSPIAQKVATIYMTKQGCKVDVADCGSIALDKTKNTLYDLILMDIGLGDGADGFEVTRQIKQESNLNQKTPIMAVTSHDGPDYRNKAKESGMIGYFNKPFTEKEAKILLEALKNLSE